MKSLNKTHVLVVVVMLFSILNIWSQTNKSFTRFYFKLSPDLEFSSPKKVLSHSELINLNTDYEFNIKNAYTFTKAQIEKLSKLSKTNFTLKNTFRIEGFFSEIEKKYFLNTLKKTDKLLYAYSANTQPIKPPHDISPITTDFEPNQGYLESNPGMNIRYAWNNGINGANINIRAVEYGINTNHEDLDHQNASLAPGTTINSAATTAYTEHGSAVAGIVFADKGTYGISGISYNANEYILYPEWTEEYGYNRVTATSNAIANSTAGDIVIFEMQTGGQNGEFVLAEYEQVIWDLSKAASDAGIIIVAAAGNGNENLDDTFYDSYNARGDSGALIIGAGSSNTSHNKMSFSTYGSRVDMHGWGQNVYATASYGSSIVFGSDFNQSYYPSFSGTSSATATLGGFTAVLQSYHLAQTGTYMSPAAMRSLIVNTGIAQGTGGNIGPFPNMEAAIISLNNTLGINNFAYDTDFFMYPNPAKSVLNIKTKSNHSKNISIYSILGKKIKEINSTNSHTTINLSAFSKGIYLVKIKSEDKIASKKLIIN
ncbi:S8/S53 family peptidase [Aurantibacter sp.]|uniref:S8/S53 family peptidase n=1 Tax=Aurantibacter sp. TaxID=2807103 RepID=UPI0035C7E231